MLTLDDLTILDSLAVPVLSCRGCGAEFADHYDFVGLGLGVYVCLACEPATVWCQDCLDGHAHPEPVATGAFTRPPCPGR